MGEPVMLQQPELRLPVGNEADGSIRTKKVILMPLQSLTTLMMLAELASTNESLAKMAALGLSLPEGAQKHLRLPALGRVRHDYGAYGHLVSDRLLGRGMSYPEVRVAAAIAYSYVLNQAVKMGLIAVPAKEGEEPAKPPVQVDADFSPAPGASTS